MKFRFHIVVFAVLLVAALPIAPAFAANVEQLGVNYQVAVQAYENAVVEQEQNADEIAAIEADIAEANASLEKTREQLGATAVSLYKTTCGHNPLLELVFNSSSFQEAVMRYDTYVKVERYYVEQARQMKVQRANLETQRTALEARKLEIESKVTEARQAAESAEQALRDAVHSDGEEYHQVQGNGSNCGATAFIVGVNILLHENKFPDNVKVWEGAGFQRDSTNNLALRGKAWLLANDLGDTIGIEEVPGDISTPEALREQLENGNVVVISSGAASKFLRKDASSLDGVDETGDSTEREGTGAKSDENDPNSATFPDGHWIVFYHYEEGFFYANDSSVTKDKGAGVAYSTEQLTQWLEGRSTHFATIMYKK